MIQYAAAVAGVGVFSSLTGRVSLPAAITLVIALLIADSLLLVML